MPPLMSVLVCSCMPMSAVARCHCSRSTSPTRLTARWNPCGALVKPTGAVQARLKRRSESPDIPAVHAMGRLSPLAHQEAAADREAWQDPGPAEDQPLAARLAGRRHAESAEPAGLAGFNLAGAVEAQWQAAQHGRQCMPAQANALQPERPDLQDAAPEQPEHPQAAAAAPAPQAWRGTGPTAAEHVDADQHEAAAPVKPLLDPPQLQQPFWYDSDPPPDLQQPQQPQQQQPEHAEGQVQAQAQAQIEAQPEARSPAQAAGRTPWFQLQPQPVQPVGQNTAPALPLITPPASPARQDQQQAVPDTPDDPEVDAAAVACTAVSMAAPPQVLLSPRLTIGFPCVPLMI